MKPAHNGLASFIDDMKQYFAFFRFMMKRIINTAADHSQR